MKRHDPHTMQTFEDVTSASRQSGRRTILTVGALRKELVGNSRTTLEVVIPAFLYTLQNNLLYYALSQLDATCVSSFVSSQTPDDMKKNFSEIVIKKSYRIFVVYHICRSKNFYVPFIKLLNRGCIK